MQLAATDEIVLLSGTAPIRAKKARYYEDRRLQSRVLPPPSSATGNNEPVLRLGASPSDWEMAAAPQIDPSISELDGSRDADADNAGIRQNPELPEHESVMPEASPAVQLFEFAEDEPDDISETKRLRDKMRNIARQAALDPDDGMEI